MWQLPILGFVKKSNHPIGTNENASLVLFSYKLTFAFRCSLNSNPFFLFWENLFLINIPHFHFVTCFINDVYWISPQDGNANANANRSLKLSSADQLINLRDE